MIENSDILNKKNIKGLVSIGIPAYNRPDVLRRILDIAISQTYTNLEIIVANDASPDIKVQEVIDEFSSSDSRIKSYHQTQNKGVLANAVFVLKKASGEYFTWFSEDDWRSPEFIEILVSKLENNKNVSMAFCDYHEVNEDGSRALGYPKTHLPIFKPFTSQLRLIRTVAYFLQDASRGKQNIFYSVFRKAAIDKLDIKKISGEYKNINMDSLIVFSLLQNGPVVIASEAMCALTCGNKKYYTLEKSTNKKGVLGKFARFFWEHANDRELFIKNTDSFLEKIIMNFLFLPRLIIMLFLRAFKISFFGNSKKVNRVDELSENEGHDIVQNRKLELPNITLVAMATRDVEETLEALVYSCRGIKFGKVKLLAHYSPHGLNIHKNIEFLRIKKMKNIDEWSHEIIYHLNDYIDTDFALLVHADGFVVNPMSWKNEFLNYDYIGAPFPLPSDNFSYRDINGHIVRVGNSVSLRSKRLLELPVKLDLPWEPYKGFYNEDGFICVKNRHIYESKGIKFAPLKVAKYFSHENMLPELKNIKPFMFHKWAGSNSRYPKF